MTTAIEKHLARIAFYAEDMELRADQLAGVAGHDSAFAGLDRDATVDDLLAAAGSSNIAGALARLRTIEDSDRSRPSTAGPFRERSPIIVDGEFTETPAPNNDPS
jgi:hypothetical protein